MARDLAMDEKTYIKSSIPYFRWLEYSNTWQNVYKVYKQALYICSSLGGNYRLKIKHFRHARHTVYLMKYAHMFVIYVAVGILAVPVHSHDDVIKRKHCPRHWHFATEIQRSPMDSPNKGKWRRALMFSMMYARTNYWANSRYAGDSRCHGTHYDVPLMTWWIYPYQLVLRNWRWCNRMTAAMSV